MSGYQYHVGNNICYVSDSPSSMISDDLFANSGRDAHLSTSRQNSAGTPDKQFKSHTMVTTQKLEDCNEVLPLNNKDNSRAFFRPISPNEVYTIEDSDNSSQGTPTCTSKSDKVNLDYDMDTSVVLHESMKKITLVDDSDKSSVSILEMSVESEVMNYATEKSTDLCILSSAKKHVIKNWLSNISLNYSDKLKCEASKLEREDTNLKNTFCMDKIIHQALSPLDESVLENKVINADNLNSMIKSNYSPTTLENRKLTLNSNIANIKKDEVLEKSNELVGRYHFRKNRREGKENVLDGKISDALSSNLYFDSKEQSVCIRNPTVKKTSNESSSISARSNNRVSYRQKKRLKIKKCMSGDEEEYMSNIINSVMSTKLGSDDDSFSSLRRKGSISRFVANDDEDETRSKYMPTLDTNLFTPRRKLFFRKALNSSLDDDICSEEPCQGSLLVANAITSTPMSKPDRLKGLSAFICETLNSSFQKTQNIETHEEVKSNEKSATSKSLSNKMLTNKNDERNNQYETSNCYSNESGNISPILTGDNVDNTSYRKSKRSSSVQMSFENIQKSLEEISNGTVPTYSDSAPISSGKSDGNISNDSSASKFSSNTEKIPKTCSRSSVSNDTCNKDSNIQNSSSILQSLLESNENIDSPCGKQLEKTKSTEIENKSDIFLDSAMIHSVNSSDDHDSLKGDSTENESFVLRRAGKRRNRIMSNESSDELDTNQDGELTQSNNSCGTFVDQKYIHDMPSKIDQNMSYDDLAVKDENASIKRLTVTNKESTQNDASNDRILQEHNKISKTLYEENTLPTNFEESFASIDSILCMNNDEKEQISEYSANFLRNSIEGAGTNNIRSLKEESITEQNQLTPITDEKCSPVINCFQNKSGCFQDEGDKKSPDNYFSNSRDSNVKRMSHIDNSEIVGSCNDDLEEGESLSYLPEDHTASRHDSNKFSLGNPDSQTSTQLHNSYTLDKDNGEEHNSYEHDGEENIRKQDSSPIVLSDGDDSFTYICRSKTPLKKNRLNRLIEDDVIEIIDSPRTSNKDRRQKTSYDKYQAEMLIYKENDSSFDSDVEITGDCHKIVNSSVNSSESSSNEPWVDLATYLKKKIPAISKSADEFPIVSKRTLTDVPLPSHSSSSKHTSFLLSLTQSVHEEMCHPDAVKYRESFKTHKNALIDVLFKLYNQEIFDNKLPMIEIKWSGHLTTTSGITKSSSRITKNGKVRTSVIKLSKTVVDCASKLRDVLIHELCHAANWLIDEQAGGHGPLFKKWANKVWMRFPEIPKVKVCHRYDLKWKYLYKCTYCGYELGKMKLSIKEDSCRLCGGRVTVSVN